MAELFAPVLRRKRERKTPHNFNRRRVVNPFDGRPRGDARPREGPFSTQPSVNERSQLKADRLITVEAMGAMIQSCCTHSH